MGDPAGDGISVGIVGPDRLETAVRVGADRTGRIAECAADVNVDGGIVDNQSGVLPTPPALDLGDARRESAGAGDECQNRRGQEDPKHSILLAANRLFGVGLWAVSGLEFWCRLRWGGRVVAERARVVCAPGVAGL